MLCEDTVIFQTKSTSRANKVPPPPMPDIKVRNSTQSLTNNLHAVNLCDHGSKLINYTNPHSICNFTRISNLPMVYHHPALHFDHYPYITPSLATEETTARNWSVERSLSCQSLYARSVSLMLPELAKFFSGSAYPALA
jgi:hypothetical protein